MTLANLINHLLNSENSSSCDENPVHCDVVFSPEFGEGMYGEDMEFSRAEYKERENIIVVYLQDKEN